jgi:gluconokinase
MYIIGIDIGTSSTKAVALDQNGKVLITSQVPYPTFNSSPGVSEQDPQTVWDAFVKCIHRITSTLTVAPAGVALSSAMHSVICVGADGNALSPLITWADNRASDVAVGLRNSANGSKLYQETGTPIHAMSPLCKLVWLRESQPELFKATAKFISIKEYIWHKLFGLYEVDYSIASATGLFNIKDCIWHNDALDFAGISTENLSALVNTSFIRQRVLPQVADLLNIATTLPVIIGGSDGCLANAGSFATEPGIAALTIGTSGAIRVAGTSPVLNATSMPFNYRLDERTFISGGPINNGGVALRWYAEKFLQKTLATQHDYDELLKPLDTVSAGCDGLVFLPYLLGERAPIWNSETCGVFFGITAQHAQPHFTKAVVEGIVFSLYQIAVTLEEGGLNIREVHVSGGFVRSKAWVQLLANVFGKRICLLNVDDASAIGAALIAMKALNISNSIEESAKRGMIVFEPDMHEHAIYHEKYFPLYTHLYRALILEMKIFHENRKEELTKEFTNQS